LFYTLQHAKKLNIQNATQAMAKAGLTQTAIADALDVFKESVSQWLNDNLSQ